MKQRKQVGGRNLYDFCGSKENVAAEEQAALAELLRGATPEERTKFFRQQQEGLKKMGRPTVVNTQKETTQRGIRLLRDGEGFSAN